MSVVEGNGSVGVDTPVRTAFGGTVDTVLKSSRIAPAPATLEEARTQPGRRERIEELTRRIEAEGIRYVFFQQVSVTGRVMGKGVVSTFFPQVAEKGYQLVYGATANLFTDRHGNYIGFGPEESELAAVADLDTRASRACTATATTRRPASCSTPIRGRTSSGSRTTSSRSSATSS
jgi:hypothetical protein